jgi:hypothetical protein
MPYLAPLFKSMEIQTILQLARRIIVGKLKTEHSPRSSLNLSSWNLDPKLLDG